MKRPSLTTDEVALANIDRYLEAMSSYSDEVIERIIADKRERAHELETRAHKIREVSNRLAGMLQERRNNAKSV